MKAQREVNGAGQRLFHNDREIGFIRDDTVGFVGFANEDEAALAGRVAHLALSRHREKQRAWVPSMRADHLIVRHGTRLCVVAAPSILAVLHPPSSLALGGDDWGVELELSPDERYDLLAISRARVMWTAMLESGVVGRMRQFSNDWSATGTDGDILHLPQPESRGRKQWPSWFSRGRRS